MKVKFNFKNKEVILEAEKCKSFFSKLRGLMFRSKKDFKPLIFLFGKANNYSIHSYFVNKKFLAIWLLKGRVVDVKVVRPWSLIVRPKSKVDALIEIPFKSEKEISVFTDGSKKSL